MPQRFSNEIQTEGGAYRFGPFALYPQERLLLREERRVALAPKLFDALLLLVRRAEHLVGKQELRDALWPSLHVSEASLTNTVVQLRKIVGRSGIETVSKHGYRFALPVTGEPGVERVAYERFVRAKELMAQRSVAAAGTARDLFTTSLAEQPDFAPAWAWLGRCCWFLCKFGSGDAEGAALADAAFRRAFLLDPKLASAHRFFTVFQVDVGRSEEALARLLRRVEDEPMEPEYVAGLVQVYRYRGLLSESLAAYQRATDLDPSVHTSVAHTLFARGEYAAAIERYGGRGAFYLDAAAWAALGQEGRAAELLHERLHGATFSPALGGLMRSLLLLLEGKAEESTTVMAEVESRCEPEILLYLARHHARLGRPAAALGLLERALQAGCVCARETFDADLWLRPLQTDAGFPALLRRAEEQVLRARATLT